MSPRSSVFIARRPLVLATLMLAALGIFLALATLGTLARPAGATGLDNNGVTTWLEPEGKSGVTGSASIAVQPGGARLTLLSVYVQGLTPGISYPVHVHGGTRAAPGASFGLVGSLEADGDGQAELLTSTITMSASGALVDVSLDLLADGDHFIEIHAPDGSVVASGEIPFAVADGSHRTGSLIGLALNAVDGSAAGTVTITSKLSGPAWVVLNAEGLAGETEYLVRLYAGSCETPSASFGTLGSMVSTADGQSYLLATTAEMSATGATVDLSMDLLADGDHTILVLDRQSLEPVACAAIPQQDPPSGSPGVPVIAPTGIGSLDAAISATLLGDASELAGMVRMTEIPCGPESPEGFALVPTCEEGEAEGTPVAVLPAAACEGYWVRDPLPTLETFAQHAWRLHAVVEGPEMLPSDSLWPAVDYIAIFSPRPGSFIDGLAAYIQDGQIVAVLAGCPSPDDLMLGPDGQPLPVVFGQAPTGRPAQPACADGDIIGRG